MKDMIILSGLKGSGKSTLTKILEDENVKTVKLGGYIDEYVRGLGLPLTPETKKYHSRILLAQSPNKSLIHYQAKSVQQVSGVCLIDSAVTLNDYQATKEMFKDYHIELWYIDVSDEMTRYTRMIERARSDDPVDVSGLQKFEADMHLHLQQLREKSDVILSNNSTFDIYRDKIKSEFERFLKSGNKR